MFEERVSESSPAARGVVSQEAGGARLAAVPEPSLGAAGVGRGPVSVAEVEGFLARVARVDADLSDAQRVDQVAVLERVKGAVAATQARLTADLYESQRPADAARGLRVGRTARSVGAQIALARKESPHRGNRSPASGRCPHLGLARALVAEMPHTLGALTAGVISEWQATILVRETACLTREHRGRLDARIADRLGELSDRRLEAAARQIAADLDVEAVVARRARAERDRRVSLKPEPDCMTRLSGLLPVKDGVACWAALKAAAETARAAGDPRTRGQVMADTLVERVTGRAPAEGPDVEVQLVMGTDTFLGFGTAPAWVPDYGPIPADLAWAWAHAGATDHQAADSPADQRRTTGQQSAASGAAASAGRSYRGDPTQPIGMRAAASSITDIDPDTPAGRAQRARRFLRRLFATPDGDRLVAMESGRREFTGLLREFLTARDQTCRMPTCDAPIRHADHITPHRAGGATSAANGQGLCEGCNHLKDSPASGRCPHPTGGCDPDPATPTHDIPSPGPPRPDTPTTPPHHPHPVPRACAPSRLHADLPIGASE